MEPATVCCASSKDSRYSSVARLTGDENPSRINNADFPDSTLVPKGPVCELLTLAGLFLQRSADNLQIVAGENVSVRIGRVRPVDDPARSAAE